MKEFKNIDEQIEVLKNRGLVFKDLDLAKRYLLTNNYYNIINGYGKYFQNNTDLFIKGTTFDEVRSLYFCDKQLKQAFFNFYLECRTSPKVYFCVSICRKI